LAEPPDDRTQCRDPVNPAQDSDPGTVSSQIFDFVVFLLTTLVFGVLNRLGIKHSISEERTPSWPGLSRPSTSYSQQRKQGVDARHKAGHDGAT
jgi:hypothetical protein